MNIHPTAIISPEAEIHPSVEIGAYAVLEGAVKIGEGCRVLPHAQILGDVDLGAGCSVGRGAVIGDFPQDLSYDPAVRSGVVIGEKTVIREHVTVHRSASEGGVTRLGARNFLMVGSHVGHDVQMGDDNVLANAVLLAGHCRIGNHGFFGGGSVVHQFVRIGDYVMIQGISGFSKDLPHFTLAGRVNVLFGLNVVGLRRAGLSREVRKELKAAYKSIYESGKNRAQALDEFPADLEGEVGRFVSFFREPSKKGVCGAGVE